jgi:hypothetical protein
VDPEHKGSLPVPPDADLVDPAVRLNFTLDRLDMSANAIDNEAANAIGSFIALDLQLSSLDLSFNRLRAGAIAPIVDGLLQNTKLLVLELTGAFV